MPTGIKHEIKPSGIFPPLETHAEASTELWKYFAQQEAKGNYKSAEENHAAFAGEVDRLIKAGYITKFNNYEDLKRHFGEVSISKVAAIIKNRDDGIQKVRIIIDMLRSKVDAFVKLSERIVLPRLMDIVSDILALVEAASWAEGEDGER